MTIHTDLEQAFQRADVILLLDEWWSEDSGAENEEEKEKKMKGVSARYREYGHLIDTRASKEVKVIVSGDSFVNLRCSLLLDDTHSIASHRYVAVATQLENEARAVVARKLKVRTSGSCGKLSVVVDTDSFLGLSTTRTDHVSLCFCSRCYRCHRVGKHQWSLLR